MEVPSINVIQYIGGHVGIAIFIFGFFWEPSEIPDDTFTSRHDSISKYLCIFAGWGIAFAFLVLDPATVASQYGF
ncbi:MAG: hypothetical protein NUV54_00860 [Candidatus Taylorbacteria bacterium]|nr:hypothetical protein [Candidatus Taylorbacteria bacterium]